MLKQTKRYVHKSMFLQHALSCHVRHRSLLFSSDLSLLIFSLSVFLMVEIKLEKYLFSFFRYHDYVAEMLEGDCAVHHAPWAGDGGSLDTRYILQCLPLLLSSSVYEPVHYDAIIFNAGLHDVDCCNFPKEVIGQKMIFGKSYDRNILMISMSF